MLQILYGRFGCAMHSQGGRITAILPAPSYGGITRIRFEGHPARSREISQHKLPWFELYFRCHYNYQEERCQLAFMPDRRG